MTGSRSDLSVGNGQILMNPWGLRTFSFVATVQKDSDEPLQFLKSLHIATER